MRVLNTQPLSVSLHKIPEGTKLPYFTSDIEYIQIMARIPINKRFYKGHLLIQITFSLIYVLIQIII